MRGARRGVGQGVSTPGCLSFVRFQFHNLVSIAVFSHSFIFPKLFSLMAKVYVPSIIIVTKGKTHTSVGIDVDYFMPQTVKVLMIKYTKQVLDDFSESIHSEHVKLACGRPPLCSLS